MFYCFYKYMDLILIYQTLCKIFFCSSGGTRTHNPQWETGLKPVVYRQFHHRTIITIMSKNLKQKTPLFGEGFWNIICIKYYTLSLKVVSAKSPPINDMCKFFICVCLICFINIWYFLKVSSFIKNLLLRRNLPLHQL